MFLRHGLVLAGLLGSVKSTAVIAAPPKAEQKTVSNEAPAKIKVEIASFDQIQKAIAKYQGKVVVVDYWSTWCPPCVKELPELVQLHKELGDKIVCLTVDVDFAGVDGEKPEQHQENVLGVLTKHQAVMRNFISSDPDLAVFEKLKVGSVPALHVFDRTGKLHKRFDNENEAFGNDGFSIIKHVKPVVLELLK
jgi:thiol-disulfide isomerase/thioredoxin